jgi:hypothetical protein
MLYITFLVTYAHNLELYNSKSLVAMWSLYKLPNNIKQIGNNNLLKKELKELLINKDMKSARPVYLKFQARGMKQN